MAPTFESTFRVRSYELDALGHANYAVFLNYFEQARVEALDDAGFAWGELLDRGWLFNVVHVEVDYRASARVGDVLRVSTTVDAIGNTSLTVLHRASRADGVAVVAEGRVVGVLVGPDDRPMRIPDAMREAIG